MTQIDSLPLAVMAAFLITAILLPVLCPLAKRIGLVDEPGGRKTHSRSIPLIGGIAMFCGFLFGVLLLDFSLNHFRALFAGSALLLIIGVLDDFHELSALTRFLFQIIAALIMCLWGGVVITDLGGLIGSASLPLGSFAIPFTVFSVVGVINAINMIDGMDGLSGSVTLVAVVALGAFALSVGYAEAAALLALLASVILAFLVFNLRLPGRPRALVFMGDSGSMVVGYLLSWFLIELSQQPVTAYAPVTALWILAVPLIDTVATMLHRLLARRSPFSPDCTHLHHRLLDHGHGVAFTLASITGITALLAGIGFAGEWLALPEWVMFAGFLALATLYFVMTRQHANRLHTKATTSS